MPLPRRVSPFNHETLGSYLRRPAHANRLDPKALRGYVAGGSRIRSLPVDRLAIVAGISLCTRWSSVPPARCAPSPVVQRSRSGAGCIRSKSSACATAGGLARRIRSSLSWTISLMSCGHTGSTCAWSAGSGERRSPGGESGWQRYRLSGVPERAVDGEPRSPASASLASVSVPRSSRS